jgi:WD40 repeat protein
MRSSAISVQKKLSLSGHRDCVYSLAPSASASVFYSAAGDGMVVSWDTSSPETKGVLIAQAGAPVYAISYLSNENALLAGQNQEGIHWIDLAHRERKKSAQITRSAIFAIAATEDKIWVACGDGTLVVLDYALSTLARLNLSSNSLRALSVHPNGSEIAVGSSDWKIRILDTQTLQMKQSIDAHQNSVFALRHSPDGRFLLSGSRDAHLKIWTTDLQGAYQCHQDIVAHMYTINDIAYSNDAKFFATCSKDKSIKLWNADNFQLLKVLDKARHAGHGTSVNRLLWTGGAHELASCSDDRSISVWNFFIAPM